jgi:hypothetical protein
MYSIRIRENAGMIFGVIAIIMIFYLYFYTDMSEGFELQRRCGIDMPLCPESLRCINGYCRSDSTPRMPKCSDLPVRPESHGLFPDYCRE